MKQSRKLSEKLVDEKDHKKMENFKEVSTHKSSKVMEKNKDQKLVSKSVPKGDDQVKSRHSDTENEVPNRKKDEQLKHKKEFSFMSKEDKDRRSSSEKEEKMPIPKMIFRLDKMKSTTEPIYTSILVEAIIQPMRMPALTETTLAAQPASVSSLVAADSSPARNACSFMVMEMDADSLFERATAIKRQGDKSEANMFQKMVFYIEAAMLYLAAAVKIGPRATHRLKDTISFCAVFQLIKHSDIEKEMVQKLQAISSMILSLVHFNIYIFNFKKSLHSGIKESLTNHRMTKILSPAQAATGAPQAAVGSNLSLMSKSPRPSPSSVTSAGSTSNTNGYSAEPATGAVLSSTTFAANETEQSAPSSSLPHSLMVEAENYFDIIEHINKAHEIWREAKMFTRLQENVEFFANMNDEVGAVELTSPINHVMPRNEIHYGWHQQTSKTYCIINVTSTTEDSYRISQHIASHSYRISYRI